MTEPKTTCQICGRAIRLNSRTGLIADHGYRQPWLRYGTGDGSRTARCPGSRHLPYELSRDAIPPVRTDYESAALDARASAAKLIADPPETLTRYADAWGKRKVVFERPADFSTKARYSLAFNYAGEFDRRIRALYEAARHADEAAASLTARYAAWVAPAEAA